MRNVKSYIYIYIYTYQKIIFKEGKTFIRTWAIKLLNTETTKVLMRQILEVN